VLFQEGTHRRLNYVKTECFVHLVLVANETKKLKETRTSTYKLKSHYDVGNCL